MNKLFLLFLRKGIIFLSPFIILLCYYFCSDPFKIICKYDSYQNYPIVLNSSYVCWQNYLNNRDSIPYDSYLFGNSYTMAYRAQDWSKYLDDAHPVRLYGNAEPLYSIYRKIECLDRMGVPMKNVLMLLDRSILSKPTANKSSSRIMHPSIMNNDFEVQMVMLRKFLTPSCLCAILDYKCFGTYRSYMKGIIGTGKDYICPVSNDLINPRELEIQEKGDKYWEEHSGEFPKRDGVERENGQIIGPRQEKILRQIETILRKHNTDYRIVISPEYKQYRFNGEDLAKLHHIFDADRVYDFSGVNEFTDDVHNYYEKVHYRPALGKKLLEKMYGDSAN